MKIQQPVSAILYIYAVYVDHYDAFVVFPKKKEYKRMEYNVQVHKHTHTHNV